MKYEILLANNVAEINTTNTSGVNAGNSILVSTLLSNLMSYGYTLSIKAVEKIQLLSEAELHIFWNNIKPALDEVTGNNRNMDAFVVYKNFPSEVLNKTEAEYWFNQILMYIGFPNDLFTEEVKQRDPLFEKISLKVLSVAEDNALNTIFKNYMNNKSRWSDNQSKYANWLLANTQQTTISLSDFAFKENGIKTIYEAMKLGITVSINDATDVLRLAATMSEQDTSLRNNVKFRNFTKPERRVLLGLLENTKNLSDDLATRKTLWKKLLSRLHPGDFKFEKVKTVYNELYNNKVKSFNSKIETMINTIHENNKPKVSYEIKSGNYKLEDLKQVYTKRAENKPETYVVKQDDKRLVEELKQRPGEFLRRFHAVYNLMNKEAVSGFITVIPKLKTVQLLKFKKYIETVNNRKTFIYPPRGKWNLAQFVENTKTEITEKDLSILVNALSKELKKRMKEKFPTGVLLDDAVKNIKLQTNDQELAEYGRGTVFNIPENIKFFRSASFWSIKSNSNIWFDNGWNFFSEDWKSVGACSWNEQTYKGKSAIFSGDPTNSKDMDGRACQMIDLYLEKLIASGVRYAVWNILAYSNISFSSADDVLATLQMGEHAEKGKLYEPSRAQMVFKLKGDNLTKYIAYIDLVERKLVYMDANFNGCVSSASRNGETLEAKMPAFLEYMDSLPSVHDLLSYAKKGKTPVLFTDKDVKIETEEAYVFKKENSNNDFKDINLTSILE